jgi:hypothetical protein
LPYLGEVGLGHRLDGDPDRDGDDAGRNRQDSKPHAAPA